MEEIKNKYLQAAHEVYDKISFAILSPLMQDKEQLKMSAHELNGQRLNIVAVDYIAYTKNNKDIEHGVVVFQEHPNNFYFAGMKLSEWIKGIIEVVDLVEFNAYLAENPIPVDFEVIKTKSNNTLLDFKLAF